MVTQNDRLPHIDEHSSSVAAKPDLAWEALLRVVEGSFDAEATGRVAGLLGCADTKLLGSRRRLIGAAKRRAERS